MDDRTATAPLATRTDFIVVRCEHCEASRERRCEALRGIAGALRGIARWALRSIAGHAARKSVTVSPSIPINPAAFNCAM